MTEPVVQMQKVVAHDGLGSLQGLELALPGGSRGALVGSLADGIGCLGDVLAGLLRVRRGLVRVGGADPWRSAGVRRRIGYLPWQPSFPPGFSVKQVLEYAQRARGDTAPREDWQPLLEWSKDTNTDVGRLSRSEQRTLGLALALAVPRGRLFALVDPLRETLVDAAWLREVLQRKASQGAVVLVATPNIEHARQLVDDVATLEMGRIGRPIGGPDPERLIPGSLAQMMVWCDAPARLAAELSRDSRVVGVMWSGHDAKDALVVAAREIDVCGRAVAQAVATSGIELHGMRAMTPALDEVQAASAGLLLAHRHMNAYRSALQQRGGTVGR